MLLGHRDLEETTISLHLSKQRLNATASPLDPTKNSVLIESVEFARQSL